MKKCTLFIIIAAALLYGCSADNKASDAGAEDMNVTVDEAVSEEAYVEGGGGETAPDPTVYTDRDGVIAFIGDIFIEPDNATDFTYSYTDNGTEKSAAMGYSLDGGNWDVRYATGVYFHMDYEPQNEFTSSIENNMSLDKECEWKGLVVKPRYYYVRYNSDYQDDMYYFLVDWYFEDTEELYSISYFGSEPAKFEPEKVFKY